MSWHRFKVKGKHYLTKRMRTIDVVARSDTAAKQKAITKKLLPPFSCEEISFDPPTKTTINNAQKAGIEIPLNASNDDVISLIEGKGDIMPAAGLMAFAERWDIYFSQYISNKNLYNLLFKDLLPINKAAFFIFSIYKFLSNDKKANLETHPYKDIFYEFATAVLDDKRVLRSINNYQGEQLCYFGKTIDMPTDYKSGSMNTIAYKSALCFINKHFTETFMPTATPTNTSTVPKTKIPTTAAIVNKNLSVKPSTPVNKEVLEKKEIIPTKIISPNPVVFILSKTDYSIPAGALKLKSQIIKIPDLEKKNLSDLSVYHRTEVLVFPQTVVESPVQTIDIPAKQSRNIGCFAILIIFLLIAIMIFSFLF